MSHQSLASAPIRCHTAENAAENTVQFHGDPFSDPMLLLDGFLNPSILPDGIVSSQSNHPPGSSTFVFVCPSCSQPSFAAAAERCLACSLSISGVTVALERLLQSNECRCSSQADWEWQFQTSNEGALLLCLFCPRCGIFDAADCSSF
jgi:hypothetical protein